MLDTDVDTLLDISVADTFVDYDANGRFGYVVDDTSFTVVDFVGHAFLDGAVGFDVDDISNSGVQLARNNGGRLLELLGNRLLVLS